jgi:hypothetical protein
MSVYSCKSNTPDYCFCRKCFPLHNYYIKGNDYKEHRITNKWFQKSSTECKPRRHTDNGRAFSMCLYSLKEREARIDILWA